MLLFSLITGIGKNYLYIPIRQEIFIESTHVIINFYWFHMS